MKTEMTLFEAHQIRRVYDEEAEIWRFSVIDIVQVLTQQVDYQTARKYWNKLKQRLNQAGSQSVTDCNQLKLPAADGKKVVTPNNYLPPDKQQSVGFVDQKGENYG